MKNVYINNFIKFFIISYTSYIFIKHINKPLLRKKSQYIQKIYKDTSTQTELTKNDINNLQKFKKIIEDIDTGTYQWNII